MFGSLATSSEKRKLIKNRSERCDIWQSILFLSMVSSKTVSQRPLGML